MSSILVTHAGNPRPLSPAMIDAWCVECCCRSTAAAAAAAAQACVAMLVGDRLAYQLCNRWSSAMTVVGWRGRAVLGAWQIKQIRQESLNDLHVEKFRSVHRRPVRGRSSQTRPGRAARAAQAAGSANGIRHRDTAPSVTSMASVD